ncbi:hypothetical protein BH10CYA1_BH10CYA1_19060 [soil metagenome]
MRKTNLVHLQNVRRKHTDAAINPSEFDDIYNNVDLSQSSTLDLAREILGNYKVRVQNVRLEFLQNITKDSLNFLAGQKLQERQKMNMDDIIAESMKSVVDEVFTTLEPYISQFNKAVACTQLSVSCTSPALVKEVLSFDSLRRPVHTVSSYRARVSTCRFSMVVRGQHDRVDFFVLPVEKVMALTNIESQHTPMMTFSGEHNGIGLIDWQVEGKPLTSDRLERYCLHLFDYLIEQTRDHIAFSNNQFFLAGAV